MKILFLSFYFEPDLSAGSFRNTSLFYELKDKITEDDFLEVITTEPNRYGSYDIQAKTQEKFAENIIVNRIKIPKHNNGILGQVKTFKSFYFKALKIIRNKEYDLVYASSSRLFTAFLGARIANKKNAKLYLDIRDIFKETILDVYKDQFFLKFALNAILTPIERYTFSKANHINLVSEGFRSYFDDYKTSYSYFTNGIDTIFIDYEKRNSKNDNKIKEILYAGNIGEGQGLHHIIPEMARALEGSYKFVIIGDGGVRDKLTTELESKQIKNVEVIPPVKREKLLKAYENTDFLFLHLNDYDAFKRVLPSKLFEYAAFNKPIIAGVSGYAAKFINDHLSNVIQFSPGDSNTAVRMLENYNYKTTDRQAFVDRFSRNKINRKMAESILNT